jgi:hypothetical protein
MTIMYNRSGIYASRSENTEFQSIFATHYIFSVKLNRNTFEFRVEI